MPPYARTWDELSEDEQLRRILSAQSSRRFTLGGPRRFTTIGRARIPQATLDELAQTGVAGLSFGAPMRQADRPLTGMPLTGATDRPLTGADVALEREATRRAIDENQLAREVARRAFHAPTATEATIRETGQLSDFARRKDVMPTEISFGARPRSVSGIFPIGARPQAAETRYRTAGNITALRQDAELESDPNYPAAMRARERELLTGAGASPGVTTEILRQQEAVRRREHERSMLATREVGNQARQAARESGMSERQANELANRVELAQLLRFRELVQAQQQQERFGPSAAARGLFGEPESAQLLDELEERIRSLGGAGADRAGRPGSPASEAPAELSGADPGDYERESDGSVWRVHPDGRVERIR